MIQLTTADEMKRLAGELTHSFENVERYAKQVSPHDFHLRVDLYCKSIISLNELLNVKIVGRQLGYDRDKNVLLAIEKACVAARIITQLLDIDNDNNITSNHVGSADYKQCRARIYQYRRQLSGIVSWLVAIFQASVVSQL